MFLSAIKISNLALAFFLELCVLVAFGYWGFHTGQGTLAEIGLVECLQRRLVVRADRVPGEGVGQLCVEPVELEHCAGHRLPLVEAIDRNQAAAPSEGRAERGFLRHRFGAGIEQSLTDREIAGPRRNKPPTQRDHHLRGCSLEAVCLKTGRSLTSSSALL